MNDNYLISNVEMYFNEIRDIPLLTAEEEISLAKLIEKGNDAKNKLRSNHKSQEIINELMNDVKLGDEAFSKFILANSRLVINVAKIYVRNNISIEDLIQEGYIGLIKAIQKFDYRKGFRFSTYAKWWIWQSISRSLSKLSSSIHIPAYMMDAIKRENKIRIRLTQSLGRQPKDDEVKALMFISENKFALLKELSKPIISLDTNVYNDSEITIGETIKNDIPCVEELIENNYIAEQIKNSMAKLSKSEQKVIKLLFGLETGEPTTYQEAGKMLGISKERIRQIKVKALSKLEHIFQDTLFYQ